MDTGKETKNEKEADYVARYLAPWNNPRNRVPRKEWQYEHIRKSMQIKRARILGENADGRG